MEKKKISIFRKTKGKSKQFNLHFCWQGKRLKTNICTSLTLIKIFVPIAGLHLGAELVPQAMQLPLEGIQARHRRLKKARLNDAHVDSKIVDVSPLKVKVEWCHTRS